MTDRLNALRAMAARQPDNALARFGLANELLKAGLLEEATVELQAYLERHADEGNGWLRYADALHTLGRTDEARRAAQRGIEAAQQNGHPGMVGELEERLDDWQ